jgi:hypothetical protein
VFLQSMWYPDFKHLMAQLSSTSGSGRGAALVPSRQNTVFPNPAALSPGGAHAMQWEAGVAADRLFDELNELAPHDVVYLGKAPRFAAAPTANISSGVHERMAAFATDCVGPIWGLSEEQLAQLLKAFQ